MSAPPERKRLVRALAAFPEGRVALVIAGIALLLAPVVPEYYLHILLLAQIFAIFALSLDVLMGYVGLPSLGHAAFFGVGGYTVGLLIVRYGVAWGPAALAGNTRGKMTAGAPAGLL